ncbi:Mu transposase C-terminal domain-containing protein [Arthrobacter sp. YAF34]|uniref:Mu transposase C-terminal domain-containing protein n=1 Tax=Arthrobacter sp. YAF34 TaxID=3233083 RepID=UPI003F90978D
MIRNVFQIGDTVIYLTRQWEITHSGVSLLGLLDVDTGERVAASVARVSEENPAGDRLGRRIAQLSTAESEAARTGVTAERQAELLKDVSRRQTDIEEVAFGKAYGASDYREGFGPGSSQWSRAGLKEAELRAVGEQLKDRDPELAKKLAMSRSALFRLATAYVQEGPACLLDGRRTHNYRVTDNVAREVLEICATVNREHVHAPRVSRDQRVAVVKMRIQEEYPERGFSVPVDRRLRRILKELSKGMHLDGDAVNRESAANVPDRVFRTRPALLPGSEMQVDSTLLDILVIFPDGSVRRPDAAMMSDRATHCVAATALAKKICGADLAFMIAQSMTPRPRFDVPLELKNLWEMKRRDMPWIEMFDPAERERLDAMVPLFRPRMIITDNGRDYRSRTVDAAGRLIGFTIVRSAPYTPTDKAIAENLFGTIKKKFLAKLPGFTGGSISSRGKRKWKKSELLTLWEFSWLLDRWLVHVWHNTPTNGLRDPRLGGGPLLSPIAEYEAMFPYVGFIPKPLSRNDRIGLLPMLSRTIQNDGIQIEYRMYDAPELSVLRRRTSGTTLDGQWEVHYMPADPRVVWVYDPETGNYINCEWKEDRLDIPFASDIRTLALQILDDGRVDPAFTGSKTTMSFIEVALQELRRQRKKQAGMDIEREIQNVQRGIHPNIDTILDSEGYVSDTPEGANDESEDEPDDEDLEGFEGVNGVRR